MSVLAAIGVLALLIVVHELGHFAAARLQKIHVNRFSIGFGPVLFKYQGPQTEYALRAIPLGGFVGFPDDETGGEISLDDPDLLSNRPLLDRAIVISAGVIANLIFAYLLIVTQIATIGTPVYTYSPGVIIPEVITREVQSEPSAAQKAGLQAGDLVLAVDAEALPAEETALPHLMELIQNAPGETLALTIERDGQTLEFPVTPIADGEGNGKIGVVLAPNQTVSRNRSSLIQAFGQGAMEFQRLTTLTINGFGQLIMNFGETAEQVAGPVRIVEIGSTLARSDAGNLFQFGALISINLAIINTLPLPALDGGQLALLIVEGLRGKPLPTQLQEGIMQTGLVVLLSLGVFLIIRDTANLAVIQDLWQAR
ncbi:MAG: RIP metalloprotease RseP [Cyanobacteria bacterium P01_G01_bin.54]